MALPNGTDVLILAEDSGNPGTFNVVGSQRGATQDETTAVIDVSNKTQRERKVLAGRYESTISLEQLYVPTDQGFLDLRASLRNGTLLKIRRQESGTDKEEITGVVTQMSQDFPDQAESVISVEIAVDGAWAAV